MTTKELEKNIEKLSVIKQLHLAEKIIENLNKPDPNIEQQWAKESDKRLKAYKQGRLKNISIKNLTTR